MIWVGLGVAIAGFFIGVGLESLGEAIEKFNKIRKDGGK